MWGSSIFSKASSLCFVTKEVALVSRRGKLEHRAGWQRRECKYSSSPLQCGEGVQSRDGGVRIRPCHSFLFTQHKIPVLAMEEERLRLFIPHVPATLRPMASISLRHKYNIIFFVFLHLCESGQKHIPEKRQGILICSLLLSTPLISFFVFEIPCFVLFFLGELNLSSPCRPVPLILFFISFPPKEADLQQGPGVSCDHTHVHVDSELASF